MAQVRVVQDSSADDRLRDLRIATWLPAEVEHEVRVLMSGPANQEAMDRCIDLGAYPSAWAVKGRVPGETREDDILRALVCAASKRHGIALARRAELLRMHPRLLAKRLGCTEPEVWGALSRDKAVHVPRVAR